MGYGLLTGTLCVVLLCHPCLAGDKVSLLPISERPEHLKILVKSLAGARLAEMEPVKILDVGSERGVFIRELSKLLEQRGVKSELYGVDDWQCYGSFADMVWRSVSGSMPENTILFSSVANLSPKFDKYFDYVFINSPPIKRHIKIIEASMKLLKEDGYCVVRYKEDERPLANSDIMLNAAMHGWKIGRMYLTFPEGSEALSCEAYIISKGESNPVKRMLFETIFGARLTAKEVGGSA